MVFDDVPAISSIINATGYKNWRQKKAHGARGDVTDLKEQRLDDEDEAEAATLTRSRTMSRAGAAALEEKEAHVEKKEEPATGLRHNKSSFFRHPEEAPTGKKEGGMRRGKSFSVSLSAAVSTYYSKAFECGLFYHLHCG